MLQLLKKTNNVNNMEDTIKIFIAGFQKWAKINKVTQKDICAVIGKDQTTISNYFNGKTRPDHETIEIIVEHYNLNYDEILSEGKGKIKHTTTKQGDDDLLEKIKLQQEIIELQRDKIRLLEQRLGEGKQVTENQGPLPKQA